MATIPGAAGPGAPFPQWTYNTQSHVVSRVNSAAAKAGAIAVTFPAKLIFFTSEAAATAYMTSQGGGANVSNTPATAGANALGSAATAIAGTTGTATGACAMSIPVVGCILTKTQARALIGGAMIAGSAIVGLVGILLLAAEGFRASGAGAALNRTGSLLERVPVPPIRAAGSAAKTAPSKAVPGVKKSQGTSGTVKKPAVAKPAPKPAVPKQRQPAPKGP